MIDLVRKKFWNYDLILSLIRFDSRFESYYSMTITLQICPNYDAQIQ